MNEQDHFSNQASIQILALTSLSDEWNNRHILNDVHQKIKDGIRQFIVDLSQLSIINSVGINLLLGILKKVQQFDGQLLITNASAQVLHILDITKLSSIFTIKGSVEEAMENLENSLIV